MGCPLCLDQSLRWKYTRVRVYLQFLCPCCVLLLELLVPYDLFISYDLNPLFLTICTLLGSTLGYLPGFLFLFLLHRHFTWHHYWRYSKVFCSSFTIGTSLGIGACYYSCLVGYICVTFVQPCSGSFSTSHRSPLFLLVNWFSSPIGMMLNNSARFLSDVLFASLIVAKYVFVVGCFNASTKYRADSVAASADDTLGIFTFWGDIPICQKWFWSCLCHKHILTPILFQCWTDILSSYSVFVPCCQLSRFFMRN